MTDPAAPYRAFCTCGHRVLLHDLADPRTKRRGMRLGCSVQTAAGYCGCTLYRAAATTEETPKVP